MLSMQERIDSDGYLLVVREYSHHQYLEIAVW